MKHAEETYESSQQGLRSPPVLFCSFWFFLKSTALWSWNQKEHNLSITRCRNIEVSFFANFFKGRCWEATKEGLFCKSNSNLHVLHPLICSFHAGWSFASCRSSHSKLHSHSFLRLYFVLSNTTLDIMIRIIDWNDYLTGCGNTILIYIFNTHLVSPNAAQQQHFPLKQLSYLGCLTT